MPSPDEEKEEIPDGSGGLPQPDPALNGVLAKSAAHSGKGRAETLTEHSAMTRAAALTIAQRIGPAGILAAYPAFWMWAEWAALLHDAGKVAAGFQLQLTSRGMTWGERHEVLSLAYVDLLTAALSDEDRTMIAAGVLFHHRCLNELSQKYPTEPEREGDWEKQFGFNPNADPGRPKAQLAQALHVALLAWLAGRLGSGAPGPGGPKLWQRARTMFAAAEDHWDSVPDAEGLAAVLLQGAVTLADRSASANVELDAGTPLPFGYINSVPVPYPHQADAAVTDGHLVLLSPTGSGKTESGLGWASRQMETMPGQPRLVWLLPYRASIDAIRDRFATYFDCAADGIGVLHATTAATLLSRVVCDDHAPGPDDARKARAMAGAMRLFKQRVRVATPHQLLRAALAGPSYASVLLERANSMFVLDELHAYDPETFGRICAAMRLWEQLGSHWADKARASRDGFSSAFLRFTEPFHDRSEFAKRLEENFDTAEVLLRSDLPEYRDRLSSRNSDPMLAAELLIPVSLRQRIVLGAEHDTELGVWIADAPYSPRAGLEIARPAAPDTIL